MIQSEEGVRSIPAEDRVGKTIERPSWDEYFLEIAKLVSTRATCPRMKVGSVLVKDKRIISTGYNGAPKGLPTCLQVGCKMIDGHCQRVLHSESNAIIQCSYLGTSSQGSTLYTIFTPCQKCAKEIINAGVVRVVVPKIQGTLSKSDHGKDFTLEMFTLANVKLDYI